MSPRFEPGREHAVNVRYWSQAVHSRLHRPDDVASWQRSVVPGKLTFADDRFTLAPSNSTHAVSYMGSMVQFETRESATVPYAAVTAIRFVAAYLEVEFREGGSTAAIAFTPAKAADRERLEWELALRLPHAMERALESGRGPAPTPLRPTGTKRAKTAPPSADHAMDDLGERMTGLGSSLAPPPSEQRAPPRSGLGSGLFPAPPADDDDA